MRRIDHIVVHCSATKPSADIGVDEIRAMHKAKGWSDIGYHYVIRRDGTLEVGRPEGRPGAHVKGHNAYTMGICLVGGLNEDGVPADDYNVEQLITARKLCQRLVRVHSDRFHRVAVLGHRDFSEDLNGDGELQPSEWMKACPCFDARRWFYGDIGND